MTLDAPSEWRRFHANTGHPSFDSIEFSAKPTATVYERPDKRIAAFLHPELSEKRLQIDLEIADYDLFNLSLLGGARYARIGAQSGTEISVRKNHMSFIPAGCRKRLDVMGPTNTLTVSLRAGLLGSLGSEMPAVTQVPFSNVDNPKLAQLLRMIAGEIDRPGFASDILIDGLVRAIGGAMAQHSTIRTDRPDDRLHIAPRRLARVLEFIDDNLSNPLKLTDLAAVAGLSEFHFSRVFKRQTGCTPYHLVTRRRLELACGLLDQGDVPLAEMALRCGFSSQAHFTTAFAKHMGMPPGRYRRSAHRVAKSMTKAAW